MKYGKIVVTGGASFVGSHAVEFFADNMMQVVAVDNMSRGKALGQAGTDSPNYNWNYLSGKKDVELVNTSVSDSGVMARLISDADAVVHTT